MRGLIRPCLFAFARLGLFLTVTAWLAGQWWNINVHGHIGISFGININHSDWILSVTQAERLPWAVRLTPVSTVDWTEYDNAVAEADMRLPGISIWHRPFQVLAAIYHWLIVSIFALFYAVLKRVYRKQPVSEPGDNRSAQD